MSRISMLHAFSSRHPFFSGLSSLQSEINFLSSRVSSLVRRSSSKNSATVMPKAAQHRSMVLTVGLLPRFIMLEIVDYGRSACFANWYFDHPRSSRRADIRAIKSISFTTSLRYNFIQKVRSSVRTNGLYRFIVHLRLSSIERNDVERRTINLSFKRVQKNTARPLQKKTLARPISGMASISFDWLGLYLLYVLEHRVNNIVNLSSILCGKLFHLLCKE